jgi:predicted enzyme related to lactoylglutathione lyase
VVNLHGRFVWYELHTTDVKGAAAFYTDVVGWGTRDVSMPGRGYNIFTVGTAPVSGLMTLSDEARQRGAIPSWIGYVGVNDVDAATELTKKLGGAVQLEPTDVANFSRFSVITDPQAAMLALIKLQNPEQEQAADFGQPGHVGWRELLAADWEKAMAFYGALFDWGKGNAETGPMGTYQLFSVAGHNIGGIFNKPAMVPVPFWLYYFDVADIDVAAERVKAAGGAVVEGPSPVPGGWVLRATDPQGATFALMGARASKAMGYFERSAPRNPSDPRGKRWSW